MKSLTNSKVAKSSYSSKKVSKQYAKVRIKRESPGISEKISIH